MPVGASPTGVTLEEITPYVVTPDGVESVFGESLCVRHDSAATVSDNPDGAASVTFEPDGAPFDTAKPLGFQPIRHFAGRRHPA